MTDQPVSRPAAAEAQPLPPDVPNPPERLNDVQSLKEDLLEKLCYSVGKDPIVARPHDWLTAAILVVRDRIVARWMPSTRQPYATGAKRVYYLSLEFLIGRLLRDQMSNIGIAENLNRALAELGVDLDFTAELEPDAALGNGGLGRLAACFMDSMATVDIPAYGYGIRYAHGLFRQQIVDGEQVEVPEDWLNHGNPWEFERQEARYPIGFGGHVVSEQGPDGLPRQTWTPSEFVYAVAYDTPIAGWRARRVNTLRLWSSQANDPIQLDRFNSGDHVGALTNTAIAETITQVLYPSDATPAGQELRLRQEFFFTSASLQDICRRHQQQYGGLGNLADKVAIQLNDTHPAVAVAELMRILIDDNRFTWDDAWSITRGCIAYTNHTLMPEALESWPVQLFERLLPRHMQIVYAINARLLAEAQTRAGNDVLSPISLIDEQHGRRLRMGQLAFVGAHRVNGVSALHSELMKVTVFRDLHRLYPDRITNKTNGVTPRRWLFEANPGLTALIREAIGDTFLDDFDRLEDLVPFAEDAEFRKKFRAVKRANKERLAKLVKHRLNAVVAPDALFDVQIKRIHEYKRQLLNILDTIALYNEMRAHPERDWVKRVKFFAGKAAASYVRAKEIIHLANDVARVVNNDPAVRDLLKVHFLPNYNVSLAEVIVPATDLSEQISTAGMEASGTGNMKFAMNGALTIGTLDGANVEIRERVGEENIFIFGLTADEVAKRHAEGHDPGAIIAQSHVLSDVLEAIGSGVFSPGGQDRYRGLVDDLRYHDWWMVVADFAAYRQAHRQACALWSDPDAWDRKAILNTSRTAWFSSDRTIREYAKDIWNVPTK
jgi:starch phosphorylase